MKLKSVMGALAACTFGMAVMVGAASAQGIEDPARDAYLETFKGKSVIFIPHSMGFDLAQGWYEGLKSQADYLGYKLEFRDPNWNVDAGTQALTQAVNQKPDVIVVQNPDVQSYARILQRAQQQGIYVIQVNLKSSVATDVYVGADWVEIGRQQALKMVKLCGKDSGKSGKVSIVQGILTSAGSVFQSKGIYDVLKDHPEITVVSDQAGDWDANKARSITQTVLQQHPDLCGIFGFWDGMDGGSAAAIREAGKQGEVALLTSGGGAQVDCDAVRDGTFTTVFSYDVPNQAREINTVIKTLLQTKPEPGSVKYNLYTQLVELTPESVGPGVCWTPKAPQ